MCKYTVPHSGQTSQFDFIGRGSRNQLCLEMLPGQKQESLDKLWIQTKYLTQILKQDRMIKLAKQELKAGKTCQTSADDQLKRNLSRLRNSIPLQDHF